MNRRRRTRDRLTWLAHNTLSDLRRYRRGALLTAVGVCTAAVLGAVVFAAHHTAERVSPVLRDSAAVIAYLRDDMTPARAAALRDALAGMPGVRSARLVTGVEAVARLRTHIPSGAGWLEGAGDDLLPASIELALAPEPGLQRRADDLAGRLRGFDGVASVDGMGRELERLATWLDVARRMGMVSALLALLVAGLAIALAAATARRDRRAEMEILFALGATPVEAALPVALASGFAAILGTGAGLALTIGIYRAARPLLNDALVPLSVPTPAFLGAVEVGLVLLAGVTAGGLVGALSRRPTRLGLALAIILAVLPGSVRAQEDAPTLARLGARSMLLAEQSRVARQLGRHRALSFYRATRVAALAFAVAPGERIAQERALHLGRTLLARDLGESRALQVEQIRVAEEMRTLARAATAARAEGVEPRSRFAPQSPVTGPVVARFGPATDPSTGLEIRRTHIEFLARGGETVRGTAAGVVHDVNCAAGRACQVLVVHADRWQSLVWGLRDVRVKPGDQLPVGGALGIATRGVDGAPIVGLAIWHGRRAVDPQRILRK